MYLKPVLACFDLSVIRHSYRQKMKLNVGVFQRRVTFDESDSFEVVGSDQDSP